MTINGNSLASYGLILIKKSGFFDMPARLQPVAYDWGDEIEPFVTAEDMNYQGQLFKAECIFDPRLGSTLAATITALEALEEIIIEIEGQSGPVGQYLCNIQNVGLNRGVGNVEKVTINFYHRKPLFNATLPTPAPLGSSHFGGFPFRQFGILVAYKQDFNSLNELKTSKKTTYLESAKKSLYRSLKRVTLNCYLVGSSQTDRLDKMEKFKKVLAQEGLHQLTHGGVTFAETFFTDGFKTKLVGEKVLNFTMTLNVL